MPQSGWSVAPVRLNTVYNAMKYQRPIKITATHTVLTVSTTTMLGPRSPPRASFAVSTIRPWAVCSGIGTSRFSGDIILTRAGGGRFPLRKADRRCRRSLKLRSQGILAGSSLRNADRNLQPFSNGVGPCGDGSFKSPFFGGVLALHLAVVVDRPGLSLSDYSISYFAHVSPIWRQSRSLREGSDDGIVPHA